MIQPIYPFASSIVRNNRHYVGKFLHGKAEGVTVHYTADRELNRTIKSLADKDCSYHLIIERDGKVVQTCYLDQATYHAGFAQWNGKSPNKQHVSVALMSWGYLKEQDGNKVSWAKKIVPDEESALRPNNIDGATKYWDKATEAQEKKLLEVLRWFVASGIPIADICGHDECALPAGRKEDPGGVLSVSMKELRGLLGTVIAKV